VGVATDVVTLIAHELEQPTHVNLDAVLMTAQRAIGETELLSEADRMEAALDICLYAPRDPIAG
jgi:hypothetical protein